MGNERILNGKPISDLQQSDDYTDILCTSTSPSIKTERKEIEEGNRHYTVNVKEPKKKKLVSSQKGTIFFFFSSPFSRSLFVVTFNLLERIGDEFF